YAHKIDAIYLFPLPTGAAVNELEIVNGGRTPVGELGRREDAAHTYVEAQQPNHVTALLTKKHPNLFTHSVANLQTGAAVRVALRYVQQLVEEDGAYELVFPMVAGPRYVPKTSHADAATVQPTVLPPGQRPAHDIGLTAELDTGVALVDVR